MSFFKSDIVQKEMEDIDRLQNEVYDSTFLFSSMTKYDRIKHVELMEKLLQKQETLYSRLTLSDDPKAKEMKDSIIDAAISMGFPEDINPLDIFKNMSKIIENMKNSINNS